MMKQNPKTLEKQQKIEGFFKAPRPFGEGIALLRSLALKTKAEEDFKWGIPIYTLGGKNVFGICRFKAYFGIWFYQGAILKDPKGVLENAQEGKTKAMRSWRFTTVEGMDQELVLDYMREALENQKKGLQIEAERKAAPTIPMLLQGQLEGNKALRAAFNGLPPYRQREYCEYIEEAKQEPTKLRRLEKILPLIEKGLGLNDAYR